jgi:dihydroflavonol-4-reductase
MATLVTGGTGYVGSHTVAALHRAGIPLRLLVRDPAKVRPALAPLGVDPDTVDVVTGDVTSPAAVGSALRGCDSIVHATAVYSFDPRRHHEMRTVNARGAEVVLGAARAAGVDPVVHVSTFGVLRPVAPAPLTGAEPVGDTRETYLATKCEAEHVARRHQAEGAPVVITYPAAMLGPHDPHLGDQTMRLRDTLRGLMPFWPRGGFPIGDVRDLARLHTAVLEPGHGPRRFLGPGRYVTTGEYLATLRAVTGRGLPALRLPSTALLPVGVLADTVSRALEVRVPVQYGAIHTCRISGPLDTSAADELTGGPAFPLATTVADTVRWLYRTGRLTERQAGRAAHEAAPVR